MRQLAALGATLALACWAPQARASSGPFSGPLGDAITKAGGRSCSDAERNKVTLSPETEYWLGRAAVAKVLSPYAPAGRVAEIFEPDTLAAVYLSQVGHTLVEASGTEPGSDAGTAPLRGFHFILVRDQVPEAWSFPGGFVVVTAGLLMRMSTEEQLAGVLAHELAHLRKQHVQAVWREALCRHRGSKLSAEAQTELLVTLALKAVTETGFPASFENDADVEASRNSQQAGYAPLGLDDFLARTAHDPGAGLLKRHPPSDARRKAMEDQLQAAKVAGRSPNEAVRTVRFVRVMVEGGLRPDWKPILDFYRR